ncbi:putative Chymotrypsinogen 2, partial [Hypsibius exemplaris]
PRCSVGDFECPYARPGDPETCFQPSKLCDGNVDCPGGADEHCPTGCGTPVNKPILSTKTGERIVGGIDARPHSWPWQISMLSNGRHNCGGSIIDHHWVVTAAHCCTSGPSTYKVRVGEHDIVDGQGEVNAWTYDVERVIQHPLYQGREQHDDICLLKTVLPIFFNDDVFPVCLGSGTPPEVGTDCFTTGWGSQRQVISPPRMGEEDEAEVLQKEEDSKQDRVPNILQQVDLKVVDQAECARVYGSHSRPITITPDMICGENPGKDSCQGDSGGPFVCMSRGNSSIWELVGVVSWGYGCASPGIPGVYARTSHFLDWIAETIYND